MRPARRGRESERPAGSAGDTDVHEEDAALRFTWTRTQHEHRPPCPSTARARESSRRTGGAVLRLVLRPVPESELRLVPKGTRYVTVFLVNGRAPGRKARAGSRLHLPDEVRADVRRRLRSRARTSGALGRSDDIDERIGDLQYRDCYEYGVGHGVSVWAKPDVDRRRRVPFTARRVATCSDAEARR